MALNAHLLTWLRPRIAGDGGAEDPHLDQLTSNYYGASPAKAAKMQRQRFQSTVGGSNAPLYLYSDGKQVGRRSRALDVIGVLRQDERIAGFGDVLGIVDCQKKIIAVKIRGKDMHERTHGGFLSSGVYYLPGMKLNMHLSWA